jgi:hypothetical protein
LHHIQHTQFVKVKESLCETTYPLTALPCVRRCYLHRRVELAAVTCHTTLSHSRSPPRSLAQTLSSARILGRGAPKASAQRATARAEHRRQSQETSDALADVHALQGSHIPTGNASLPVEKGATLRHPSDHERRTIYSKQAKLKRFFHQGDPDDAATMRRSVHE